MFHKKNIWKIKKWNIDTLTIVEITDSAIKVISSRELFLGFLMRLPQKGNFYSVSQLFSPAQSIREEYDNTIIKLHKIVPFKFATTSNYDTEEGIGKTEDDYVIHAFDSGLNDALLNVLYFSGSPLSNIIYSFNEDGNGWLQKVTNWNKSFVQFFWLKSSNDALINLVSQVELLLWTSDGHLNIVVKNASDLEQYLILLQEIAKENSLILKVNT